MESFPMRGWDGIYAEKGGSGCGPSHPLMNTSMNEITRNLWIGDLPSALNIQQLRENNIHSVLSVMRGKIKINETFIRLQIELDDTQEADILSQFLPAIQFIGGELEKERGVLVHCLAGISRSATIVAAYLVYTLKVTPDEAVGIILKERPFVQPNPGFTRQLNLFHDHQGKISGADKDIRRFYLEKTVHEVTSGDGSRLAIDMLSEFPNPPSDSTQTRSITLTKSTSLRQRRIRCKMCRHDLATREHMLDHGRLGSSTENPSECRPQINSTLDHSSSGATSDSNAELVSTLKDGSDTENVEVTTSQPVGQQISDPIPAVIGSRSELATSSDSPSPTSRSPSESSEQVRQQYPNPTHTSPPTLIDPKCSGYFVEPMKWMDHFLSAGSLSGKITCPNKKCNAKLGNYDWAGVCCGCKIWVTPGFCINRSKVDEVV